MAAGHVRTHRLAKVTSDYRFTTEEDAVDHALVHRWLSEQSYWDNGRSRDTLDAAIDGSRNYSVLEVGLYRQFGFTALAEPGRWMVRGRS